MGFFLIKALFSGDDEIISKKLHNIPSGFAAIIDLTSALHNPTIAFGALGSPRRVSRGLNENNVLVLPLAGGLRSKPRKYCKRLYINAMTYHN